MKNTLKLSFTKITFTSMKIIFTYHKVNSNKEFYCTIFFLVPKEAHLGVLIGKPNKFIIGSWIKIHWHPLKNETEIPNSIPQILFIKPENF